MTTNSSRADTEIKQLYVKESVKTSFHCNPYDGGMKFLEIFVCIVYTAVLDNCFPKGCNVYEITLPI